MKSGRIPAIGCCLTAGTFMPQGTDASSAELDAVDSLWEGITEALRLGYDFVELTVGSLMNLTDPDFERLQQKLEGAGLVIPVFNSFIPASLKLTGPSVNEAEWAQYLNQAMKRVKEAGGEIIVFGSGGARRLPEGFSAEEGWKQIKKFLTMCSGYASEYGLTIAIEPLNSTECNMLNTVQQGLDLAEELHLPGIQVLADAYHMHLEKEPFEHIIRTAEAGLLAHVHYAEFDRSFPLGDEAEGVELEALFETLRDCGYQGRISAECMTSRTTQDKGNSLRYVKELWNHI